MDSIRLVCSCRLWQPVERNHRSKPMNSSFLVAALLAATLTITQADEISLFNGKDLNTWQEPLGTWSVVGAVSLDSANPKAFTTKPGEGVFINNATGKSVNLTSKAEHGD